MMKKIKYFAVICLITLGSCFMAPTLVGAQPLTHTVVKGDTLWDICEKYYGDPNLWPQLWEMNPFITNPHLLEPGDVITLFTAEALSRLKSGKGVGTGLGAVSAKTKGVPEGEMKIPGQLPFISGIDVSYLTNIEAIGYLSRKKVKPWGHIFFTRADRIMSSKGESIFVIFEKGKVVKPGDQFTICRSTGSLKNPVRIGSVGYVLSVGGRLVIEEPVTQETMETLESEFYKKENVYKAKITESYVDIHVGDLVIPYEHVSPCVKPIPIDREMLGNIVAVKNQMGLIGQYSIVYLDQGFDDGVQRGDLYKVVEPRRSKGVDLPDRVLGTIIILETRPDTATALVLSAKEDISNGAYIKGFWFVEPPTFLTLIPRCSVQ